MKPMRKCADYKTFQSLGEKLDKAEGKDKWKRFSPQLTLRNQLQELLDSAGEDSFSTLRFAALTWLCLVNVDRCTCDRATQPRRAYEEVPRNDGP